MTTTFDKARDAYLHQSSLRSPHTRDAYLRAIDLFLDYLNDRAFPDRLPVQSHLKATAGQLRLSALGEGDQPILHLFAKWLQTRSYARSTVNLRLAGVQRWFEFMAKKGWLPTSFSVDKAVEYWKSHSPAEPEPDDGNGETVAAGHDLSALLEYYSQQKPPKSVQKDSQRLHRWNLTRLRNHALLQMLAETGGQISALLQINVADLNGARRPLRIAITGKNQHQYAITLDDSLPAVREYLRTRGEIPQKSPVFVSHDARFEGQRMSRVIAWRIIQRAARAVGLPRVGPHDLRHWRARQLIRDGHSLEEVKNLLGHRSIHTVRAYYGGLVEDDAS